MKKLFALAIALVTVLVMSMSASALSTDIDINDDWESVPSGDVNHDYSVDIRDLIRLEKRVAGNEVYVYEKASDFDGNQVLNASDMVMLRKLLLGIKL